VRLASDAETPLLGQLSGVGEEGRRGRTGSCRIDDLMDELSLVTAIFFGCDAHAKLHGHTTDTFPLGPVNQTGVLQCSAIHCCICIENQVAPDPRDTKHFANLKLAQLRAS